MTPRSLLLLEEGSTRRTRILGRVKSTITGVGVSARPVFPARSLHSIRTENFVRHTGVTGNLPLIPAAVLDPLGNRLQGPLASSA